jgi:MFS family permease
MHNNQRLRFFIFVVLTGTIGQLAAEIYIPSLPYIARDFHAKESLVQLSISYFLLGMASTGIIFGYISDYIGRRKVLFVGALIGAMGTVICILSSNIYWLIFGRLIQGIGFSGMSGIGRAILRDRLQGIEFAKYAAYLITAISLSTDLAPFIGGFLQAYIGWRIVFALILVYTLLLVYMIYRYQDISVASNINNAVVPSFANTHTNVRIGTRTDTHWYKLLSACILVCKDSNFLRYSIISGIPYAIFMMYLAIAPFIIQNVLHKSPIWFGTMVFILSFLYAGSAYINGQLLNRINIISLLKFGMWLILLSAILLIVIGFLQLSLILFILAIIPMFIGAAFIFSTSDSLSFATLETNIGVASTLISSIRLIYGFIFTALISCFDPSNTIPLGVIFFILISSGLLMIKNQKIINHN